jgi:hypothetical protein
MVRILLLFTVLFQGGAQTALKPLIENDRVAAWDVTGSIDAQPLDAVVVWLSGRAEFLPKGTTRRSPKGRSPKERSEDQS